MDAARVPWWGWGVSSRMGKVGRGGAGRWGNQPKLLPGPVPSAFLVATYPVTDSTTTFQAVGDKQ